MELGFGPQLRRLEEKIALNAAASINSLSELVHMWK